MSQKPPINGHPHHSKHLWNAGFKPAGTPASGGPERHLPGGRTAGFQPAPNHAVLRTRGYLPHYEIDGATYFVTFHLADSLPCAVLRELVAQRDEAISRIRHQHKGAFAAEKLRIMEAHNCRIEEWLHKGIGSCHLAVPDVAAVVAASLRFFDGERYKLDAWCVMPNHVHVVFCAFTGFGLDKILHSWKSYTANKANRILGRSETFWAREYYDRVVRDWEDYEARVQYVLDNPKKAGLEDWEWVWVAGMDGED